MLSELQDLPDSDFYNYRIKVTVSTDLTLTEVIKITMSQNIISWLLF